MTTEQRESDCGVYDGPEQRVIQIDAVQMARLFRDLKVINAKQSGGVVFWSFSGGIELTFDLSDRFWVHVLSPAAEYLNAF